MTDIRSFVNTITQVSYSSLGYIGSQGSLETTFQPANRAIIIGDFAVGQQFFSQGGYAVQANTSTGGMVVSGTTATFNCLSGSHLPLGQTQGPGQYVFIWNQGEFLSSTNYWSVLNGAALPVISTTGSSFTVSSSYGGQTMPPGDYSARGPGQLGWNIGHLGNVTNNSLFKWIQMTNGNPFRLVAVYADLDGLQPDSKLTSGVMVNLLPKIQAGPAFNYAFVELGSADLWYTASTSTAITSATTAINNIKTICNTLTNYLNARVILSIPPPVGLGAGSWASAANVGYAQLRAGLLQYAMRTPGVTVVDIYRNLVDINGNLNSSYADAYYNIYPTTQSFYTVAKNESARLTPLFIAGENTNPVSSVDDAYTYPQNYPVPTTLYPNLLNNGMMNNAAPIAPYNNISGYLPNGWSITSYSANGTYTSVTLTVGDRASAPGQNANARYWGRELKANIRGIANPGTSTQLIQLISPISTTVTNTILAANTTSGIWLKAGFTVRSISTAVNLSFLQGTLNLPGTGGASFNWGSNAFSATPYTSDQLPLLPGDVLDIWSDELFMPSNYSVFNTTLPYAELLISIGLSTGTTATCNLAFSSAFVRQVDSPYTNYPSYTQPY